jgi:hypothetical protein
MAVALGKDDYIAGPEMDRGLAREPAPAAALGHHVILDQRI